MKPRDRVWLFDLDDTLHNASHRAFRELNASMTAYIETHLGLATQDAVALRHPLGDLAQHIEIDVVHGGSGRGEPAG